VSERPLSLIVAVRGEDKSGKSSFTLSAADYLEQYQLKLFYMGMDIGGYDRAAWRFTKHVQEGRIIRKDYPIPLQAVRDRLLKGFKQAARLTGYKELWYQQILPDYIGALEDPAIGAIVMDSFSLFWEINCQCYLQEKQEAQPVGQAPREQLTQIEYREPNHRMRNVAYASKEAGKILLLTHPMTDEREQKLTSNGTLESVSTGRRKEQGWGHIGAVCDVMVETQFKERRNGTQTVKEPAVRVILNGMAKATEGLELPIASYTALVQLIEMTRVV
jgi:hypothetical protein